MLTQDVLEAMTALRAASTKVWIEGGFAVDFLCGSRRPHGDLDVAIEAGQLERGVAALEDIGFAVRASSAEAATLHRGDAIVDLQERAGVPVVRVEIEGAELLCAAPEAELERRTRGRISEGDLAAVRQLAEHFHLPLPARCRAWAPAALRTGAKRAVCRTLSLGRSDRWPAWLPRRGRR